MYIGVTGQKCIFAYYDSLRVRVGLDVDLASAFHSKLSCSWVQIQSGLSQFDHTLQLSLANESVFDFRIWLFNIAEIDEEFRKGEWRRDLRHVDHSELNPLIVLLDFLHEQHSFFLIQEIEIDVDLLDWVQQGLRYIFWVDFSQC